MKYRLNKVIDRHFPKHDYTNFQLVQVSDTTTATKKHSLKGSPSRRKRHPIGRMKYHCQYALAQEFRKCTNGNLFIPAPVSLIQSLKVDPTAVCLDHDNEEVHTLCLDNPVSTETVNSEQARVEKDTDSGIDQSEVTADQPKPTEQIKTKTEKEQVVEQQPSQEDKPEKERATEELDEFFGVEENVRETCVKVKEDGSSKPPCQLVDSDSDDSDFEADVTTMCTKAEDSVTLTAGATEAELPQKVEDINATGELVKDTTNSNSEVLESAKLKVEKQVEVSAAPVKAEHSPFKAEHSPVKAEHSPVKAEHSPVKAEHSPVKAEHSPVKAEHSPVKVEHSTSSTEDAKSNASKGSADNKSKDQVPLILNKENVKQTNVHTNAKNTQPRQRVEHTVSIPTPVNDSSTEEETSAEKLTIEKDETDSVKPIIKTKPGCNSAQSEKSVSFSNKS